jgi:hypothetical protein
MTETIRTILVVLSSIFSTMYVVAGILFATHNQWLLSNMDRFFPVLSRMNLSYATTLGQFLVWSLILPLVTFGIHTSNQNVMFIAMALSITEVYLGCTFYVEIEDITGAWIHIILHGAIIAALIHLMVKG